MKITVTSAALGGSIEAINSKSYAHRLLICAALADRPSFVACRTRSEDILATADCLRALGADIADTPEGFRVRPVEAPAQNAHLLCGESGSTLRFMLPVVCALGAPAQLHMKGRLPERPLLPLYEELSAHGAILSPAGDNPLCVSGRLRGNSFTLRADVSSQFISGLLLALPLLGGGTVKLTGRVESRSYIDITADCMRKCGVAVTEGDSGYTVSGSYAPPAVLQTEGDWSNAAFWLVAGCVGERPVTITGLNPDSVQGDRDAVDILRALGARIEVTPLAVTAYPSKLRGTKIDAQNVPDLVPVTAAAAASAEGETVIYNAARLRLKESDRLAAVEDILKKLGADIAQTPDGLIIKKSTLRGGAVSSWGDHRIAMTAAVAAVSAAGEISIENAQCVNKSYPDFFADFEKLGGSTRQEKP